MCLLYKSVENTMEKGEIAHNEQFFLFPQCFLPFWTTFCHFLFAILDNFLPFPFPSVFYPFGQLSAIFIKFKIVVCKRFEFGRLKILTFGKGLRVIERVENMGDRNIVVTVTSIISFFTKFQSAFPQGH